MCDHHHYISSQVVPPVPSRWTTVPLSIVYSIQGSTSCYSNASVPTPSTLEKPIG